MPPNYKGAQFSQIGRPKLLTETILTDPRFLELLFFKENIHVLNFQDLRRSCENYAS